MTFPRPCLYALLAACLLLPGCVANQYAIKINAITNGDIQAGIGDVYYIMAVKGQEDDLVFLELKRNLESALPQAGLKVTKSLPHATAVLFAGYKSQTVARQTTVSEPVYGVTRVETRGTGEYINTLTGKTSKTSVSTPTYGVTGYKNTQKEVAQNKIVLLLAADSLKTKKKMWETIVTYTGNSFDNRKMLETYADVLHDFFHRVLDDREAAADFDTATKDLQTMTLTSFRKAVAVTYDKELFASTISPARSGGYGIIGNTYIYNPETGDTYRSSEQAKQVLCDFYSVDTSKYANLDEAVASITGYDPEAAKELFTEAFNEALEKGYITDKDGDGVSDQVVTIEYCMSADSDFMTKTIDYLNEKMNEVTEGTPFAGKVQFVKSAPYGNDWSNKIKSGLSDTVLAGWTGSKMNPFSLSDLYVNPAYQYDAGWFDATTVDLTLTIDGKELTMNLRQWSDALNGSTVTVNGTDYNFGEGIAEVETRLTILAGIEGKVLETYDYLPMLQDSSMALLSQQVYYVTEDYNPVMEYGGIAYLKYNYTDAEWTAYVAEQGGQLTY